MRILFSAGPDEWKIYQPFLAAALRHAQISAEVTTETNHPATIDFVIWSPDSPLQDFTAFPALRAVFSLWAGVEKAVSNQSIKVPLCRMVDTGLTAGMVEWVSGHVLRYHLGMDKHIVNKDHVWRHDVVPPLAQDRQVGILGLGALGSACATTLATLGFRVSGWSRSQKQIARVNCHSGDAGLVEILASSEILVLLLPLTAQTENLLDSTKFAQLRPGAFLVNPGRGRLIDDEALLQALQSGQVSHATLDVFRQEPLPAQHPFWHHPKITVTPHVASETRPAMACAALAAQIARWANGQPLLHVADRSAGY